MSDRRRADKQEQVVQVVQELKATDMFWVGIGASAGGLEALRNFAASLPEQSNMTYIVVQHLSPQHRSMLVDLIGRETKLLVKEITNAVIPQTDTVYITPPNNDAYVKNGKIYLKEPRESIGPKPSVDYFFNSLAEEASHKSIGIILSGTGSDGSHGIRMIRAAGGITIAQDEASAKYNGMPGAAVATGCIDLVLPPEQIAKELTSITKSPRNIELLQKKEEHVDKLSELLYKLRKRSGVDFRDYKPNTLHRRIERRMAARGIIEIDDYLEYVGKHNEELDLLFKDMLISVTSFFRDKGSFSSLTSKLKELFNQKNNEDRLRVWVPGCATGEEAYSIAIIIAEYLGGIRAFEESSIQIFATDLDADALEVARKGIYPEVSIENIDEHILGQYFRRNSNNFEVLKPVRDKIVFAKHNVVEDPPFSKIDLVTCRNLLIYFNTNLQKRVLQIFHYALNDDGILFLGKSESLGQAEDFFYVIDNKHKIYKRKLLTGQDLGNFSGGLYSVIGNKTAIRSKKDVLASQGISDAIIKATNPHSLLVNEQMDIRHVYGDVQYFTQLQSGQTTLNVMTLVKKEFQQEIRALVYKALRTGHAITGQKKRSVIGDKDYSVQVTIVPLNTKESSEKLLLVTFNKTEISENDKGDAPEQDDDPRISELEQELTSTKEHLQTVIEELETSNEELQSLNEELQSSNEELQSSNEELETSNEELQSTNEELTTVNEELQVRSGELTTTNNNLNNVKDSIDFPVILVNKNYLITLTNEAANEVFDLENSGKNPIITSVPTKFDLPNLRQNIASVLKNQKTYTEQIDTEKYAYWLQITPYYTIERKIEGAVLTFINNTETRRAETMLMESEARFRSILDHTSSLVYMKDIKGRFLLVNQKFLDHFDQKEEDIIGSSFFDIMPNEYASLIKKNIAKVTKEKTSMTFETVIPYQDELKTYISVQYPLFDKERNIYATCGILTDITERKRAEEQLNEINNELLRSNQELDDFAYTTSHDLKEPLRGILNYSDFLLEDYSHKLDDKGKNKLQTLTHLSHKMQGLIDNLLHYSRVGRMDTENSQVDINKSIEEAVALLKPTIEQRNVDVRITGKFPSISCNPVRAQEIFHHLIANAIKFNDKDHKWVEVGYDDSTDETGDVIFFVKDNGIGISPKNQDNIFSLFKRLNPKEAYGDSMGAGLTIVKKIIEYYDGKIWVESEKGKGSCFYFSLGKENKILKKLDAA